MTLAREVKEQQILNGGKDVARSKLMELAE